MKFYSLPIITGILFMAFIGCNKEEEYPDNLTEAVNIYRTEKGLNKIPESASLNFVAETHVQDLFYNHPDTGLCNSHSWSGEGNWTAGCYTNDLSGAEIMWNKPFELTTYTGYGYEITAFSTSGNITIEQIMAQWKKSEEHNNIILSRGTWSSVEWKAIGSAVFKNYAVVWFGKEPDITTENP
ncbi:MAG: hypothetical protein JW833_00635 [Prolixibacteraceae bacterium]|nr:hypothetical protein [Prolixibacteraceae bacterium]